MDNIMMGASAKTHGASWWSIAAALLGGVVGSIVLPPLGGLVLSMAGIFLAEYLRLRNLRQAWTRPAAWQSAAAGGWCCAFSSACW
jgi:uncharacterized protein